MREDNVALLKRGYQAFGKADLDAIREMGAKDEVWHTPGYGPFKPEYKGPDGVTAYLTELMTSSDGTFRTDPEAFAGDDGNHVLVLEHVTAKRKGRTLDTHVVHDFRVKDGKIAEVTEYASEPNKIRDFWA
ncbi:MAG: nuclear transport factor 2 family protein [Actinomycetota bacterium]|nr:nuclear transport factor 2 family protein [Actinomycetota bacterium]